MIILTNFGDIDNFPDYKVYSIADKQPIDLSLGDQRYEKLSIFVPDSSLSGLDPERFSDQYLNNLESKQEEIKRVVRDLLFSSVDSGILMCCWCNEDFYKGDQPFCHRIVIKKFMDRLLSYVKIELRGI